jgi:hypothetical protein
MFITCFYMSEFTTSSECILLGHHNPYECIFDKERRSIGHKLPEIYMMFSLTLGSFLKRCATASKSESSDNTEQPAIEEGGVSSGASKHDPRHDFMIELFAKTFAETVARIKDKSAHEHTTVSHTNTNDTTTNEEIYQRLLEEDPTISTCTTRDAFRKRLKQVRKRWRDLGNCPSMFNNLEHATRTLRQCAPA